MTENLSPSRTELVNHVLARTGRRVLNLDVEVSSETVILHGQAASFHVKQLAQQGIRDLLPTVRLHNAITVGL